MRVLISAVLAALAFHASAGVLGIGNSIQTPVKITEVHTRDRYANIFVRAEQASRSSQVLIFLRYRERDGFYLAKSIDGDPPFPRTRDLLPPPDDRFRSKYVSNWYMNVRLDQFQERPAEIYVVVVEVGAKYEQNRSFDIETIQYLPFKSTSSFQEVLEILRDYGWIPTGFTKSAP